MKKKKEMQEGEEKKRKGGKKKKWEKKCEKKNKKKGKSLETQRLRKIRSQEWIKNLGKERESNQARGESRNFSICRHKGSPSSPEPAQAREAPGSDRRQSDAPIASLNRPMK